jgi:hypothetical protein
MGKIAINMNEEKLGRIFPAEQIKKDSKSEDGDHYSIIKIMLKGESKTALELETMCMDICLISRITLFSDKYKTVKGIGIGSTAGELKKKCSISLVRGGEKGIMIFTDDLPQTAFIVNPSKLKSVEDKIYKITDIPDDCKIEIVYMY